jgi:hypothetical protein
MINILDIFLSKSDETYKLRDTLKNYRTPQRKRGSSCKLFILILINFNFN